MTYVLVAGRARASRRACPASVGPQVAAVVARDRRGAGRSAACGSVELELELRAVGDTQQADGQARRRRLQPGQADAQARPHDVQGHQRGHGQDQRDGATRRLDDPRREGEPRPRAVGHVHADAQARPVHPELSRAASAAATGVLTVAGRAAPAELRRSASPPPRPATRSSSSPRRTRCVGRTAAVRRRGQGRRRRQGQGAVPARARALRDDRAGRRELRRPRPADRRARQRRQAGPEVDRLPPHRAGAVAAQHDQGHGRRSPTSCWPTSRRSRPRPRR